MSERPEVSVVMGVYNGAASLAATIDSVLAQEGCALELIVVDDGSIDGTPAILRACAQRDPRLRVFGQSNAGLTSALVRGCGEARGDFIARQDCGDRSMPGRLRSQLEFLRGHPQVVMTACAVRFLAPGGELLYVSSRDGPRLQDGLRQLDVRQVKGPPHHGCTMFRRDAYQAAGGYRPFFAVAQDLDLWLRLSEHGECEGHGDVRYEARLEAGSISSVRREEQLGFAEVAVQAARLRRAGGDDREALAGARAIVRKRGGRPGRLERARFLHFIGSCLQESDPAAARGYYWQALRECPLMLKTLVRLARTKG
ncbi:MAG TPA: glycosyltransferase family 2 protein [Ramlibacter sp.]|nr:glycosyltransferase family 2 protein [Ramlibacter sp.]